MQVEDLGLPSVNHVERTFEFGYDSARQHVHKDLLDCIDDSAVVKDFVACNEVRKDIFGKGLNLPAPLDIQ